MQFHTLSEYFSKLEQTTLRNAMVEILSELFKEADAEEIGKLAYLLQGRVCPLYESNEFGVADKMMFRAIAEALQIEQEEVVKTFKKEGDVGNSVEQLRSKESGIKNKHRTIIEVYEVLSEVAASQGDGSQERKVTLLADLIREVDPLSAKYIVRITLGKLRLGFSDMTILDSLSFMESGNKDGRKAIERAYNVRPDLGYIAETVKKDGVKGLDHVLPKPGTPILMARANRLTSPAEILEKIGKCAVEYKYDGLRLQVHMKRKAGSGKRDGDIEIKMFSRNLEDVTPMFPDIATGVMEQLTPDSIIFEGEVVAYNPQTGVFVPFQETMQRKRKYDIAEKAAEIPVKLFAFELLYCDKENFIEKPYVDRKKKLHEVIKQSEHHGMTDVSNPDTIVYAQEIIAETDQDIETMFEDSVTKHFEGIVAKRLEGPYDAGVRGWNWIKFKKAMSKKLSDTVDVIVMGYTLGEGKRTSFGVGQFLAGVYDTKRDMFVTITKVGTGLTDEQFKEFIQKAKKLEVKEKPAVYDVEKLLTPDVWMAPGMVVELGSDEITRSAVHTAGREMEPTKSGKALQVKIPGYALRFPRLEKFRDDRKAEDATSVEEIAEMYQKQGSTT